MSTAKKPYRRPELTKHTRLESITGASIVPGEQNDVADDLCKLGGCPPPGGPGCPMSIISGDCPT